MLGAERNVGAQLWKKLWNKRSIVPSSGWISCRPATICKWLATCAGIWKQGREREWGGQAEREGDQVAAGRDWDGGWCVRAGRRAGVTSHELIANWQLRVEVCWTRIIWLSSTFTCCTKPPQLGHPSKYVQSYQIYMLLYELLKVNLFCLTFVMIWLGRDWTSMSWDERDKDLRERTLWRIFLSNKGCCWFWWNGWRLHSYQR